MFKKLLVSIAVVLVCARVASAQSDPIVHVATPIPNHYIVEVTADADPLAMAVLARSAHGGRVLHVYEQALHGFAIELDAAAAARLARDPQVRRVEEDSVVRISDTQSSPPWGLDRIDQRQRPVDGVFDYPSAGQAVYVHVIDTGIRPTHLDFGGRAFIGGDLIDTVSGTGLDCNGHGTHVAGTIAGATYGVAKRATLIGYRALDCSGSGSTSGVIAAINLVIGDSRRPAVINMSLGGDANTSFDNAVRSAVTAGITVVVAAGNSNADASGQSPARVAEALTVAASDASDVRASFSNFGTIVDLFAPGVSVTSAWYTSNTATAVLSGTSMASPHVAGAAALYLEATGNRTPAQVATALSTNATANVITNSSGAPNLLLYTGFLVTGPPPPPPAPATLTASPITITAGQSSTLTLTTPTTDYHNVFINGVRPTTYNCTTTCTFTLVVTPSATTTYQAAAITAAGVPYTMPSVVVTVTVPPPPPAPSTLTANPTTITAGLSSTLTLTTPTANYFNVSINGLALTSWTCSTTCTGTLVVTPSQTTTYQSAATNSGGEPYPMPSVIVTVTPAQPSTLTANPTSITAGQSSTLTLTTPTANYFNVSINGSALTSWTCSTTCTGTQVVTPSQTTTYQAAATSAGGVPYAMPSVAVTVTAAPPPPPPAATLVATPSTISAGQSSTLTITTPTNDYHNVFINGVRPTSYSCSTTCTFTLVVTPSATTTYQAAAITAAGVPYTMPSVVVTVTP